MGQRGNSHFGKNRKKERKKEKEKKMLAFLKVIFKMNNSPKISRVKNSAFFLFFFCFCFFKHFHIYKT